jgi:hypothetical protein
LFVPNATNKCNVALQFMAKDLFHMRFHASLQSTRMQAATAGDA